MTDQLRSTQAQYQGFCNTQLLWDGKLNTIEQLRLDDCKDHPFLRQLNRTYRLGQLAEQFLFNQIETCVHSELLAENLQIQNNNNTIGELDALLLHKGMPVHLEIIYKFYLYDEHLGDSEVSRWIGPNRKDSLTEKLDKLLKQQLPLLHTSECKQTLKLLHLDHSDYKQFVHFKAQLFVPFEKDVSFKKLNKSSVCGIYINRKQLEKFKTFRFFIPEKLDWFLEPRTDVNWMDFDTFIIDAHQYLTTKRSPMIWLRDESTLQKAFLVWW